MSLDTPGSLSAAIDLYLAWRKSQGFADGTLRNDRRALRKLLDVAGNILLKNVNDGHVTKYFEVAGKTRSPNALAIDHVVLNGFFAWARQTRRMPVGANPMAGRRPPKTTTKERRRVPVSKFAQLLDAVPHPRDRMVIALGLYLLLRSSEIKTIRKGDVNLENGEILIHVHKTNMQDMMPICSELDEELRRWLTVYSSECGELRPDWYLVPAKSTARYKRDPVTMRYTSEVEVKDGLRPTKPHGQSERVAHRALAGIGFLTETDAKDTPIGEGEGIHTLRRSGGRALFDSWMASDDGPRYPLRQVQSMLHHKNQATTEGYLGLEPDRFERDLLLRGKVMYRFDRENVVELRRDGSRSQTHSGV